MAAKKQMRQSVTYPLVQAHQGILRTSWFVAAVINCIYKCSIKRNLSQNCCKLNLNFNHQYVCASGVVCWILSCVLQVFKETHFLLFFLQKHWVPYMYLRNGACSESSNNDFIAARTYSLTGADARVMETRQKQCLCSVHMGTVWTLTAKVSALRGLDGRVCSDSAYFPS